MYCMVCHEYTSKTFRLGNIEAAFCVPHMPKPIGQEYRKNRESYL